ncbi:4-hydroxy-3-methylbut-2-en-1-yl diphosphate synthase [Amylibacter marinus]|uniref:4-hydroxy-3-methylbut-2-en-1-yl diphosphate synthase n=1 Tax=Amylibacter marinus TaxID=1475483 RepID=A0ABQ5VRR6_9RHOB|nr:helix-turn-helix domain-containing protein [Amylibacter marinus]GLQ34118.1 4-hydroxy-3-methylbut-2-en-1-yl diphosphate synthase [Amylibacter marinus]
MDQVSDIDGPQGYDAFSVSLGDKMRGERATLGKTLEDVESELKLRREVLVAIEDCNLEGFASPSFIAGYVRSYAAHLELDPQECFEQFCQESGFVGIQSQIDTGKTPTTKKMPNSRKQIDEALLNPRIPHRMAKSGMFAEFSLSGLVSLAVVTLLIGGLSWGSLTVLKEVQRVQFAPVNDVPTVVPHVAILNSDDSESQIDDLKTARELAEEKDRRLAELYRPTELTVPRLTPRDGPISGIDPTSFGVFAARAPDVSVEKIDAVIQPPQVTETGPLSVDVVALKPAWVRVFQADGKILFEKILDSGQRYRVPADAADALMRAGNAGAVYLMVGDDLFGPVGAGTSVARKVALSPDAIAEVYEKATPTLDNPLQAPINQAITAEAAR